MQDAGEYVSCLIVLIVDKMKLLYQPAPDKRVQAKSTKPNVTNPEGRNIFSNRVRQITGI